MPTRRALPLPFLLLAAGAAAGSDGPSAPQDPSFARDVRPLLRDHCAACHGGVRQAGDLSFAHRDLVRKVVEPGHPERSRLVERVTSTDPDRRMPPPEHGPPLGPAEVDVLRRWIAAGAAWEEPWAFRAPRAHTPPEVVRRTWALGPVDPFVLARLEAEGLEPAPDASPERWLRRAALDLTGLPPEPALRERFLRALEQGLGERAYAAAVDALLASPRTGERWATPWLDLVRYADSEGLGIDGRRTMWPYRDWVIRAFQEDVPFDRFTIAQLAGDLLPEPTLDDLVATAMHRNTQTNGEGGTDDEEFRLEAVMDRVNVTMQAWQGLTFGCVQCHAHPYDPFRHDEYYRLLAFFDGSADADLESDEPLLRVPTERAAFARARALDRELRALRLELRALERSVIEAPSLWTEARELAVGADSGTPVRLEQRAGYTEFRTVGTVPRGVRFQLETPLPALLESLVGFRVTGLPLDVERGRTYSEWGYVLSHVSAELVVPGEPEPRVLAIERVLGDEAEPFLDPQRSLDPQSAAGAGPYTRIHHARHTVFLFAASVHLPPGARLRVVLFENADAQGTPLVMRRGRLAFSGTLPVARLRFDGELVARRERLAALEQARRAIPSVALPVMREREDHLRRETRVFLRGNFLTRGERVEPGVPAVLRGAWSAAPTRLGLAQWIAAPDNPLTARVFVNHVWGELFGRGLVETREDFGTSGSPPSHPELLDDLAWRFVHVLDWSPKALLRELALSRTYRQSSAGTDAGRARDPRNRLLSRGPRRRLPAEFVRDQALWIAGLLAERPYGPPVHPPLPDGVWTPFQGGDRWDTPPPGHPDRTRRSLYTYVKRSIPYPLTAAFDAPSREFCASRRLPSNTPLQALMTWNDETFVEAARGFATWMAHAPGALDDQLAAGFLRATSRAPTAAELATLLELHARTLRDLDPRLDDAERARRALANVASVLLNLDEVLCNG